MVSLIRSLKGQEKAGTLERNTEIVFRVKAGELQTDLAKEFGITKQMVNKIYQRHLNRSSKK